MSDESHRLASQIFHCLRLLRRHMSLAIRESQFIEILTASQTKEKTVASLVTAARKAGISLQRTSLTGEAQLREEPPFIIFFRDGTLNLALHRDSDGILDRIAFDEDGTAFSCDHPIDTGNIWFVVKARPVSTGEVRAAEYQKEKPKRVRQGHWFWSVLRNFRAAMLEVTLASLSLNILRLAFPLGTMIIFDRVVPNNSISTMWSITIGLSLAILFEVVFGLLRQTLINRVSAAADQEIETTLFRQFLDRRLEHTGATAGAMASKMRDYDSVRDFAVSESLVNLVDMAFAIVFVVALIIFVGPLAWVPVAAIPVLILVTILTQSPMAKAAAEQQERSAEKNGILVETVSNLETVKANGAENWRLQSWQSAINRSLQGAGRARELTALTSALVSAVNRAVPICIIIIGVHMSQAGQLSTGALFAAMMLSGLVVAPFARFGHTVMRWHKAREAFRQLNDFMSDPAETDSRRSDEILRAPTRGAIEFRNVRFRYPETDADVLKGISFSIQPGEKVAIVGRSGSGKTSVARLLLGLYRPTEGSILLDGTDIRQIDHLALRRRIGSLMQNVGLFRGSIRDNIALGNPSADDAKILRAAELAGVDEFVRMKEDGYAFQVGENGQFLSGGEKQSVGLARAMLGAPNLLLLDEPTSAMDMAAEEAFTNRLRAYLTPDRGVVLMTHRTSLLSLVQRIIVMDGGIIRADGPRDEILKAMGLAPPKTQLRVVDPAETKQPTGMPV